MSYSMGSMYDEQRYTQRTLQCTDAYTRTEQNRTEQGGRGGITWCRYSVSSEPWQLALAARLGGGREHSVDFLRGRHEAGGGWEGGGVGGVQ